MVALGGTIASTESATGGVSPQATAHDIAQSAGLDTLPTPVEVTFEQVAQVGSGSITLDHLVQVVRIAHTARAAGVHAVVLTQGTDTLEETVFALSVLNDSGIPIVATGAMRNPTLAGTDGPANVRAAIITASDPRIQMLRAVLVFADCIHDPTFVRKVHSTAINPFESGPTVGPLGWVSEDRLILPHMPASLPPTLKVTTTSAKVAIITPGIGDPLTWVDHLEGYGGAVVAGVGGGHVPEWSVEAVGRLARRIPVVYCARTGWGRTLEATYGYPGAELDLQRAGLIPAGVLEAPKARILLMLALLSNTPARDVFSYYRQ